MDTNENAQFSDILATENNLEPLDAEIFDNGQQDQGHNLTGTDSNFGNTDEIDDNSPIEQVKLTVPITDNPTLPTLTFRTWALGILGCIVLAIETQYFSYQYYVINLTPAAVPIITFLLGNLMAKKLPTKQVRVPFPGTDWEFSLNPGPFSIKEHAVTSVLAGSGLNNPSSMMVVTIMKAYFSTNINFFVTFLSVFTSQMMGFGLAGLFKKFLVDSPEMWWPAVLDDFSMYRALHGLPYPKRASTTADELIASSVGSGMLPARNSGAQFYFIVTIVSFAYYIVPNYYFSSITALSVSCLIWKKSVLAQIIGSGFNGLGIGSFSFDWSTISNTLDNPLYLPISSLANQMFGFMLVMYILCPITYWTNTFSAKRFPFSSTDFFDFSGHSYNLSRVQGPGWEINIQAYHDYSKVYLSVVLLYAIGFDFAAVTATITDFLLRNGKEAKRLMHIIRDNDIENKDIHNKLMEKYKPIPRRWFFIFIVFLLLLSIAPNVVAVKKFELPYLGVLLAVGLVLSLKSLWLLIGGNIYPKKPVAAMTFRCYAISSIDNAQTFLYSLKLGHYIKIPPRDMFKVQILGAALSCIVNFIVGWILISDVENICGFAGDLPEGSPWTCPGANDVLNDGLMWGVVSPNLIFGPLGMYSKFYIFFLVGALATILVWLLKWYFPRCEWLEDVQVPLIFAGPTKMPRTGAVQYWSWFAIGFCFNYIVYNKYTEWWSKFTYLLGNGLDTGVALAGILINVSLNRVGIYGVEWWGYRNHCPLNVCPTAPDVVIDGCPVFS
ncbi:Oligopeptide transporter, OPT superfamily [Dillenia turbinata]|uniref:Oligopeptide transporter, OPT superfamily n=1 Tax=Dillenia turbinata TaxID=194707 RepID=A0AAN8W266_9MAGN